MIRYLTHYSVQRPGTPAAAVCGAIKGVWFTRVPSEVTCCRCATHLQRPGGDDPHQSPGGSVAL